MKNPFKAPGATALAVIIFLAGCASEKAAKPVPIPAVKAEPAEAADGALEKALQVPVVHVNGTGWKSLFDGKTLSGWQVTDFGGHGAVKCESGLLVIEAGDALSGVNWTNEVIRMNYEIALEAIKLQGDDFFCGVTIPVGKSYCSLILGGWGGGMVGISSVDGLDASENETSKIMKFDAGKWHRVRVRVTDSKIEAWLDDEKIVSLITTNRKIDVRYGEIELSKPLGLATYQTRAAMRQIQVRTLDAAELKN